MSDAAGRLSAQTTIRVGTLNCRNTADNWRRRRQVLLSQLVGLDPDVMGLQELRRLPNQARWITRAVNARSAPDAAYDSHRVDKTGLYRFWEGIGVLTRLPIVERRRLDLQGERRVASHVAVELPSGGVLDFYNAHLSSRSEEIRTAQARLLLGWMDERAANPQVLVGDFNARPGATSVQLIGDKLRSAYAVVHGKEPPKTVPTPLRGPAQGSDAVLDYIFVNGRIDVHDASVTFQEAAPDNPRLVASDHYGLAATISVRP